MNKRNIFIVVFGVIIIVGGFWFLAGMLFGRDGGLVKDGAPVNAQKDDLIWVGLPLPNQMVGSPLTVAGRARGNWYFEASFPVALLDANGVLLAQEPAQAQGEWMTSEYVPFSVMLVFTKPTTATGTLVLQRDNPSGLPQFDNELRIPVLFETRSDGY